MKHHKYKNVNKLNNFKTRDYVGEKNLAIHYLYKLIKVEIKETAKRHQ